jgi:hypothetical protein
MNERDDTPSRDALAEAWRRASDAAGDAPSHDVRAAILAEARAQAGAHRLQAQRARARQGAMQQWRLAATVSGIGLAAALALIVWRGQPQPMPVMSPSLPPTPAADVVAPARPQASAPSPAPTAASAKARRNEAPQPDTANVAQAAGSSSARDTFATGGAEADAGREAAHVPTASSRAINMPAPAAEPSALAGDSPARLLVQHFPDALERVDADDWQYWLVLGSGGRTARQGQRRVAASPPIPTWLNREVPESRGATLERYTVADGRGGTVELFILRAAGDAAR